MKVLVLGGAGFVGERVVQALARDARFSVRIASRRPRAVGSVQDIVVADGTDAPSLGRALDGCDAVVNCITGSGPTIVGSAKALAEALQAGRCKRLMHMSTMSVYGDLEGEVDETTPLPAGGGWYAEAKREAEQVLGALAGQGIAVSMLRPGCVSGPASHLWVARVGRWLEAGRLGDLGAAGDGWSNLVHVDDVAAATVAALLHGPADGRPLIANLAAPDSPRWNAYFAAFAQAIGAVPVRRIGARQLKIDAYVAGPPLRIWERLGVKLGVPDRWTPPALAPSLVRLLAQERRMRSDLASDVLGLQWTPFGENVATSAHWYVSRR